MSPFEFLTAQVLSRLLVVMSASLVVYTGASLVLDFPMRGSYAALAAIYASGALCLISLGLIVSARLRTEELADGILNLLSWPMLLLSGVWFSMEGASPAARLLSQLSPLTHVVDAARRVMIDGAMVVDVLPQILLLAGPGHGLPDAGRLVVSLGVAMGRTMQRTRKDVRGSTMPSRAGNLFADLPEPPTGEVFTELLRRHLPAGAGAGSSGSSVAPPRSRSSMTRPSRSGSFCSKVGRGCGWRARSGS